ncbi:MAG: sugar-specific transcriptional regulator TrmB [Methanomicrobiales archaeon]|nr:sugar-specific transcriptional regulator TrmB [Methanomicrobiales archaeon]NYT21236.1 sugar-specific transcriptional regulator TrmB [Methanomicrobiales archaeon]
MPGVIKRRREFLQMMRAFTLEHGYFTVTDIQKAAGVPRSTAQDWITRLIDEGCVIQREKKQGRSPARYASLSALPQSACQKIFTTVDGDQVRIYHECLSGASAAFCGYHHALAGGVVEEVRRDGTLLRESARMGRCEISIGLHPSAAVGIVGVERDGDDIIQHIRCIGGPAYSLTDMMSRADGVCDVTVGRSGGVVEGAIRTRALTHLIIGIDDTDSSEGGATFALALALLQYLGGIKGVIPIDHHIAMLNPEIPGRTAGNSCSSIELATPPEVVAKVVERTLLFVGDEALSPEWGVAVKQGFRIDPDLRAYGQEARAGRIETGEARRVAERFDIRLYGGRGITGALAAVALAGLPNEILLDPEQDVPLQGKD